VITLSYNQKPLHLQKKNFMSLKKKEAFWLKLILSISLVLTLLCSPAFSANSADWIKKANALWDGKKYTKPQKAIEYLTNFIKLQPRVALAYYNRGVAYMQIGQPKRALEDYNQAIRLQPGLAQAYINRGVLYLNQGNKKLGCMDAQKACKLRNCMLLDMAKMKKICK